VLLDDGSFRLKKGRFGEWVVIAEGGAREARMESIFDATRVALLFEDGSLRAQDVPDGPVASSGELVTLWDGADDILQFELERDRVAFLTSGDQLVTYDSGLDGVGAGSSARGAREFQLQGDMMGWLTGDGRLEVREGDGPFVSSQPIPGEVSQFRLLAHVPHPPVRTFVEDYVGALANCDPDGVTGCVSPPYLNAAVPLYGRFCGKDWPESWTGAHAAGPIDGLDALCHHHDHAGRWYGLGGDWWELDVHVEAACVVRWGLHNSRLTRDGAILAEGRDGWSAWDAAWGSNMPNLKDAVDRYLEITAICGDDRLSGFDRDTAAEYYYR
jgi:hypothetical protein